jgi:hypothetical protein
LFVYIKPKGNISSTKPKVLLLFGAGASYGSGGINKKIPLGKDLFTSLCLEYPRTWGAKIKGNLKDQFIKEGFEVGMDSLYKSSNGLEAEVAPLLVELSVFFSKFKIVNANNLYVRLVQRFDSAFRNKDIIIATLNYDCLIEYALMFSQMTFSYLHNDQEAKLLKLHGSCNFIPLGIKMSPEGLTLKIGGATFNTAFKPVLPNEVENELASISIPSAMSLYTHEKRNIVSPNSLKLILDEYQETVQSVNTIIIVGIKPNPVIDKHIWDTLTSTRARVILIGNQEASLEWVACRNSHTESIEGKFLSKFDIICSFINESLNLN